MQVKIQPQLLSWYHPSSVNIHPLGMPCTCPFYFTWDKKDNCPRLQSDRMHPALPYPSANSAMQQAEPRLSALVGGQRGRCSLTTVWASLNMWSRYTCLFWGKESSSGQAGTNFSNTCFPAHYLNKNAKIHLRLADSSKCCSQYPEDLLVCRRGKRGSMSLWCCWYLNIFSFPRDELHHFRLL